ncbi:MAG: AAA family ATPase [Eubacteriales bacterium]
MEEKRGMVLGRVIFVTSFKGGVGKTTLAANLSAVLAKMGNKVLAVDGDFGMRCLDMALGLESGFVYDINDVINGKCDADEAIIPSETVGDLFFLAAPVIKPGTLPPFNRYISLFNRLRERYDYIIIDSSAEESPYYLDFAAVSDSALVVSLHQSLSIRAAEKTGMRLREIGFKNIRLIVNCFRPEFAKENALPSLYELIRLSEIRLLGVIPFDQNAVIDQESGVAAFGTADKKASPYEVAVYNIACRVTGKNIRLLNDVLNPKKKTRYIPKN